jgi:aspartyl-tRNA(Asn)/glutamyl-tRNA(Gln) amidotransferase subunit B
MELDETRVTPQHVADLVRLIDEETLSQTAAKQVLEDVVETGDEVDDIVDRRALRRVTDTSALEAWVTEAISENPGPVDQYRRGKEGALNAVLGAVMKKSRGSADAKAVRELLLRRLSGS